MSLVDAAKALACYAAINRVAPPVLNDICGEWSKKGLSGVGAFPTDSVDGEIGPAVALLLGRDPGSHEYRIEYFWQVHGLEESSLGIDLFEALLARLPDWVTKVTMIVPETDEVHIQFCRACRMRATGLVHYETGPDGINFVRPRMMNLGR